MRIRKEFPDFRQNRKKAEQAIKNFPEHAAKATLNFSKQAFRRQGWVDTRFDRWAKRKDGSRPKGFTLIGKGSGALKKGLSISSGSKHWTISSDRKYAKIHNEGGKVTVPVTAKMRKYFWFRYYKSRKKVDKERWRAMALTKKKHFSFYMPKRQFMGKSELLNKRFELIISRALEVLVS